MSGWFLSLPWQSHCFLSQWLFIKVLVSIASRYTAGQQQFGSMKAPRLAKDNDRMCLQHCDEVEAAK